MKTASPAKLRALRWSFPNKCFRAACYTATCWDEHSLSGYHDTSQWRASSLRSLQCRCQSTPCAYLEALLCSNGKERSVALLLQYCWGMSRWHVIDVDMRHPQRDLKMFRLCWSDVKQLLVSWGDKKSGDRVRLFKDYRLESKCCYNCNSKNMVFS